MFRKNKFTISLILTLIMCLVVGTNGSFAKSVIENKLVMNDNITDKSTVMELSRTDVKLDVKDGINNLINNKAVNEPASVQPSAIEWQHLLNYQGYDYNNSKLYENTSDGGFMMGATTGDSLIWLTKIDSTGNIEWSYVYGQGNSWAVNGLSQTADNGYIVTGEINEDVFLAKFSSVGNFEWIKLFGGDKSDNGNDVIQTTGGGYFIIGTSKSYGDGHYEPLLIKTDSTGNIQWGTTLTTTTRDEFGLQTMLEPSTGNIIVRTHSTELSNDQTKLLKISNTGNLIQSKIHNDIMNGIVEHMELTSDGGFIMSGRDSEYENGEYVCKMSIAKLDSSFNSSWKKNIFVNGYDSYQDASYVSQTNDGGYAITGTASYYDSAASKSFYDIALIKVNSSGNTEWIQTYNISDVDYPSYVYQTSDSGYVLGGKIAPSGGSDIFIFKLN
ncbi:hypothetical protein [Vallitalea guaymasensis]|uniref:hypothetical protein n=1 Tax=Vallitalea guaymasensis TaxID=1185412 RepID=UPI00235209D7|nr:hypothetical protein [Vallitalea guaymasensis]